MFKQTTDAETGVPVIRLTETDGITHHPYFTHNCFSADGKSMLIRSNSDGNFDLYRFELSDGSMHRLTNCGNVAMCTALDNKRNTVYYTDQKSLFQCDFETGEERKLGDVPEGFILRDLHTNHTRHVIFCYQEDMESVGLMSLRPENTRTASMERFFRRPLTVIMVYDKDEDVMRAIWGEHEWLLHLQCAPHDDHLFTYTHNGGPARNRFYAVHNRWWLPTQGRPWVPYEETEEEKASHEFFTNDGRFGFQLLNNTAGTYEHVFTDLEGDHTRRYMFPGPHIGCHFFCRREEGPVVMDGYIDPSIPKDPRERYGRQPEKAFGRWITIARHMEDGSVRQEKLCAHNTGGNPHEAHPHPVLTPDEKHVIFSSDRGVRGQVDIYMVNISETAAKLGF